MLHLELLRQRVDLSYRGVWCQFGEHHGTDYGYAIEGHMFALHKIVEDIRSEEWELVGPRLDKTSEGDQPAN
jgi:hypothetical protein